MSSPIRDYEVITVLGPIAPEDMGIANTHEHLQVDAYEHYKGYDYVNDDVEITIQELEDYTKLGGRTICDPTTDEIGRNPQSLAQISRAAGIHVVMGSAWYREFAYPKVVEELTSNALADILVREIEVGVGDTGIRAGFIGEIGTGRQNNRSYVKPAEERVFRAAALAQARTGVAVSTHTTRWGTLAMEQIAMLKEFGADPSKIIIGHLGDRRNDENLPRIAEQGVYLEIDNVGYLDYQPEWVRADNVAALVKAGFTAQVLLSQDIFSLSHFKYHGGRGFGYLLETFIPMLRERGLSEDDIHCLLVDNPARAFARKVRNA